MIPSLDLLIWHAAIQHRQWETPERVTSFHPTTSCYLTYNQKDVLDLIEKKNIYRFQTFISLK